MSKGDTVTVVVRTPVGTHETVITARTVGAKLETQEPNKAADLFLAVEEQDRNSNMIRRFLFAKDEVLVVSNGRVDEKRGKAK